MTERALTCAPKTSLRLLCWSLIAIAALAVFGA